MAHVINEDVCAGCGVCVEQCSQNAIKEVDGKYQIIVEKCTDCGNCVGACPVGAIAKKEA